LQGVGGSAGAGGGGTRGGELAEGEDGQREQVDKWRAQTAVL
jgi:hypothetical protein